MVPCSFPSQYSPQLQLYILLVQCMPPLDKFQDNREYEVLVCPCITGTWAPNI